MLNFELVTSTVLSKVISNVLKGYGTAPRSLVVYTVFVQGDLHVYFIFICNKCQKQAKDLSTSAFRNIELSVADVVLVFREIRWLTPQLLCKKLFYVFSNALVKGIFIGVNITVKKGVIINMFGLRYFCLKHVI